MTPKCTCTFGLKSCQCATTSPQEGLVNSVVDMITEAIAEQEALGCRCRECWKPVAEKIVDKVSRKAAYTSQYGFLTERTPDGGLKL